MFPEIILLSHVVFGVFGSMMAGAVALESYFLKSWSQRKFILSVLALLLLTLALVMGGFWYILEYPEGKALIKSGPIPWAHAIVMESKEHIFFLLYLAALILPFAVMDQKRRASASDTLIGGGNGIVMVLGTIVFALGMLMEGMGGIISMAVRISMGAES